MSVFDVASSRDGGLKLRLMRPGNRFQVRENSFFSLLRDEGLLRSCYDMAEWKTSNGYVGRKDNDLGDLGKLRAVEFEGGRVYVGIPDGVYNMSAMRQSMCHFVPTTCPRFPYVDQKENISVWTETPLFPNVVLHDGKPLTRSDWIGLIASSSVVISTIWFNVSAAVVFFGVNMEKGKLAQTWTGKGMTYFLVSSASFFRYLYPWASGKDLVLNLGDVVTYPRPQRRYPYGFEMGRFYGLKGNRVIEWKKEKNVVVLECCMSGSLFEARKKRSGGLPGVYRANSNDLIILERGVWSRNLDSGNSSTDYDVSYTGPFIVTDTGKEVYPFMDTPTKTVSFLMPDGDCDLYVPFRVNVGDASVIKVAKAEIKNLSRKKTYYNNNFMISLMYNDGLFRCQDGVVKRWLEIMKRIAGHLGTDFNYFMGKYYDFDFSFGAVSLRNLPFIGQDIPYSGHTSSIPGRRGLYEMNGTGLSAGGRKIVLFKPDDCSIIDTDYRFVKQAWDMDENGRRMRSLAGLHFGGEFLLVPDLDEWGITTPGIPTLVVLTNVKPVMQKSYMDEVTSKRNWLEFIDNNPTYEDVDEDLDYAPGMREFDQCSDLDDRALNSLMKGKYELGDCWPAVKLEKHTWLVKRDFPYVEPVFMAN